MNSTNHTEDETSSKARRHRAPMSEHTGRAVGSFWGKVASALIVFLLRLFGITKE